MASVDLSNHAPNIPGPLPDSQHRHWIPDERDTFINWLKGEFAAANAIIDSLCHHLQMIGKPGEYDFVLTCIQQRRFNWTVVLHMQQYFSVAEVVYALQQVVWMRHALLSDPSALQTPFGAVENEGGSHVYRDLRGEAMMSGAVGVQHNSTREEVHGTRRDVLEVPRKSEEQIDRRDCDTSGQKRKQALAPGLETLLYASREHGNVREQGVFQNGSRNGLSAGSSTASITAFAPTTPDVKEEKEINQRSRDSAENVSTKLERSGGDSRENTFVFSSKEEEDRRHANVKVTRTYNCVEQVEGKTVNFVDGLELHERVLDKSESSKLAALILEMRASGKRGELGGGANASLKKGTKGKGKESLHFVCTNAPSCEDLKKRSSPKDDSVRPMPAFLYPVIDRLIRWHIIPASKKPDWCSINIMDEGDYVPAHVDNSHLERPYCALTLYADCTLILGQSLTMDSPGDFKGSLQILLPVGSVLVLQRNSAEIARHSISASPTKRIFITFGKSSSGKTSKGNLPSDAGISPSPPILASEALSSWNSSLNSDNHNRLGSNNSTYSSSSGRGGAERFGSSFKSHKFTPAVSSGVLPVPIARSPVQVIPNSTTSVPPLFSGTPGSVGATFPPPSMVVPPSWSPLPRPPPPNRPPTAGTGVFFPASGNSSGPGRPMSMTSGGQRRAVSTFPPALLQKTNSAPASFASLEAAAICASAPSTPPSKSSKLMSSVGSSSEKVRATPNSPRQDSKSSRVDFESSDASWSPQPSEANGATKVEEDNSARNPGLRSKSVGGNSRASC